MAPRFLKSNESIAKSDLIKIGQKLQLPEPEHYSYRNPTRHIIYQNKKIKVDRKKWQIIVVHHSATSRGNASMFDASHRKRGMQNGLAYHFVIGNGTDTQDGQIEMGSRWLKQLQGGHVKNHYINEVGIGICLVGNFEKNKPTARQLKSLTALIDWLQGSVLKKRVKFVGYKDIEKNSAQENISPSKATTENILFNREISFENPKGLQIKDIEKSPPQPLSRRRSLGKHFQP